MPDNSWLRRFRPVADPRLRLVCFPHAGGSASAYRSWPELLPGDVEVVSVQYPGRQDRLNEPCLTSMDQLADAVAAALAPPQGPPLALFGHSMGASLAHEVALRLPAAALRVLLVSARPSPRHQRPRLPSYDDPVLLAEIRRLDPEFGPLLDDPDMRDIVMPAVRADYRIADTYRPPPSLVVDAPVVAYVGDRDPLVSIWQMRDWAEVTKSGFDTVVLPGHHFYLRSQEARLLGDIARRLAPKYREDRK